MQSEKHFQKVVFAQNWQQEVDDIVRLAVSKAGARKTVGNKKFQLLLNKADTDERIAYALQICKKLDEMKDKPEVILITGYDLYESR